MEGIKYSRHNQTDNIGIISDNFTLGTQFTTIRRVVFKLSSK